MNGEKWICVGRVCAKVPKDNRREFFQGGGFGLELYRTICLERKGD